jgi:hypothetical protein
MKQEHNFFIATGEDNDYLIYSSETYRMTEIEFLNLIKICFVEARSKSIGKRLIAIYKDNKGSKAVEKLKLIGVNDGSTEPSRQRKPVLR